MYAHRITAKNWRNNIEYIDSYWLKLEDAKDHIERHKDDDKLEVDNTGDDWQYRIDRVEIK